MNNLWLFTYEPFGMKRGKFEFLNDFDSHAFIDYEV